MVKAVVDVGSNSVLLVVAERTADGWRQLAETSEVTGLGKGTKTTGRLGEPGMADTLAALQRAFAMATSLGAESVAAAATMAARIATNTSEFLERAGAQGTPVTVLSGEAEAELGFLAVAGDPLFAAVETLSIVDPGGHSTELVTAHRRGDGWDVAFRRSYPIGALALREGSLAPDAPGFPERLAAVAEIDRAIGLEYRPHTAGTVVTLGATGTNLVSIREALTSWQPEHVHGAWLDFEEVSKAVGWLSGLGDAARRAVVGLEPGREHTIHAGALILERFLYALHVLGCTVSVRGWRHALLETPETLALR